MKMNKRIPLICPIFNNFKMTKRLVENLVKVTPMDQFTCTFVDNGSTDETAGFLKTLVVKFPDNFQVITLPANKGFGGGVNEGLKAISTRDWDHTCIINNDILLPPHWLSKLLSAWTNKEESKYLGAVAPVSNAAGGSQGIKVNYATVGDFVDFSEARYQTYKESPQRFVEAGMLVGLCFLMTREMFDTVGLFDERFFPGMWEDNDYCLRGRLKGFTYRVDHAVVIHHEFSDTFRKSSFNSKDIFWRNRKLFEEKWAKEWKDNQKLIAAIRVKDGEAYLAQVISRLSEFTDGIVVLVDQHTTDRTYDIAKSFKSVIALKKEPSHDYDEAISRNMVLDMARDAGADWIMPIDADEVPEAAFIHSRKELMCPKNPETFLWTFPIIQLWNSSKTFRADGLWPKFLQGRMYRVLPNQKIRNSNDKIHCGSHPTFHPHNVGRSLLRILHYGNVEPKYRQQKYEWYTKTDTDKDLSMLLGSFKDYYWREYYGAPEANHPSFEQVTWKVDHSDPHGKPLYGTFNARDCYRHIVDEKNLKLLPFDENNTIGLCMLGHNEGPMIQRCINSISHLVNQIVVVENGDGTTGVAAESVGAEVHRYDWKHDFSAARNFSLSKMKTKWILRLDPDEEVPSYTADVIPKLVEDNEVEGYIFPIINILDNTAQPRTALSETCRLFKNNPKIKYAGIVHEEIDDSFKALEAEREEEFKKTNPNASDEEVKKHKPFSKIVRVPYEIQHFGYLRGDQFLQQKFDYYKDLGLLQIKDRPKDFRAYFTLAVHYYHSGDWTTATSHYLKVLELEPEHWMAQNDLACILWYSGKLREAQSYFRLALKNLPQDVHSMHRDRVTKNLDAVRVEMMVPLIV